MGGNVQEPQGKRAGSDERPWRNLNGTVPRVVGPVVPGDSDRPPGGQEEFIVPCFGYRFQKVFSSPFFSMHFHMTFRALIHELEDSGTVRAETGQFWNVD
jgi:hypothetical protein